MAFAVVAALSIISPVIGLRWKGNGALTWLAFAAAWGLGLFLLMTAISTVSGNSLMEYYSLMEYFPPLALIGLSVGAIGVGDLAQGLVAGQLWRFFHHLGFAAHHFLHQSRRSGHGHLAIAGVLDSAARRG